MDANLLNFLISFSSGVGANLTTSAITSIYQKVFGSRPDLANRLTNPKSPEDFESALGEVSGVIKALAGSGAVSIDGSFIKALRSARFDHQNGNISIGSSSIVAPFLHIGGSGPSGRTDIGGNTELQGSGAGISIGKGAGIVITGNAGIKIG